MSTEFQYLTRLEDNLNALITLAEDPVIADCWEMLVTLSYQGQTVGTKSFTLNSYSFEEARELATHLSDNHFIMGEIDAFLSGGYSE